MAPAAPRPINLGQISSGPVGPDEPDSETQVEQDDLETEERRIRLVGFAQDIRERRRYAGRIFWLVSLWLIAMFILLLLEGFLSRRDWFHLEPSVLLAAIGGTTVNVIGIFIVVARYLFPRSTGQPMPRQRPRQADLRR